jgi:hypothetical protein
MEYDRTSMVRIEKAIVPNETHDVVLLVQEYLFRFGYLSAGSFTRRLLDEATRRAINTFRVRRRIDLDREIDQIMIDQVTIDEIVAPRCSVPDVLPEVSRTLLRALDTEAPCVSFGADCTFTGSTPLKYGFSTLTKKLTERQIMDETGSAFESWQRALNGKITFEPTGAATPHLRLGWFKGFHTDGVECCVPFDGVGGRLGHAFPPKPCGDKRAGQCHFDDKESWDIGGIDNSIDFQTIALHEIGHLLGLGHSDNNGAVMFEKYQGRHVNLEQDDEDRIRKLYRIRGPELLVRVHFEGVGERIFRDDQLTDPSHQSQRLKGFRIEFSPARSSELRLRYMAHVDHRDSAFVDESEFVGTLNGSEAGLISGLAIELTGVQADKYDVIYMARIEDFGYTALCSNGEFCGARLSSKRIEAILVRVEPR